MKIKGKKIGMSTQIFVAMLAGAAMGIIVGKPMTQVGFIGDIWLNCIKMIVVPMVLATIINGVVSQKDIKTLGRISFRIFSYYIATTLVACAIGIAVTSFLKPGHLANFSDMKSMDISGDASITVADFFTGMFSSNMIQTFSEGNILQTVIIAILLGVAILRIKDTERREKAIHAMQVFNDMIFSLINMIMIVSPIGVFFLMAETFGKYGIGVFASMASLIGTYYLACLLHVLLVYGMVLWVTAGINPFSFLRKSVDLWVYTLSTCSSVAAIPISIRVAKEKFNVPEKISGFTIPLGSQMNYDGSVILYGCVILFISQSLGLPVSLGTMIKIVLMSAILSTGGGGIPGSGIVKLLVMVTAFGLPTEIVGVVAAFYRLFDMGTTTCNCLGDLAGTVFVNKLEERTLKKKSA
ncbi:MAG TPA: dicarboxylate/amino acid:cation symporter [Candidatus Dorea intestinavium]|nr:dicarboxylate/amino acid:cation symporter [Candidatus Dorea intestinavium]